jgi:hypothetical protein
VGLAVGVRWRGEYDSTETKDEGQESNYQPAESCQAGKGDSVHTASVYCLHELHLRPI